MTSSFFLVTFLGISQTETGFGSSVTLMRVGCFQQDRVGRMTLIERVSLNSLCPTTLYNSLYSTKEIS